MSAEEVYVTATTTATRRIYHTDRDCPKAPPEPDRDTRDRATLDAWGYAECAYCAGTFNGGGDNTDIRSASVRFQIEDGEFFDEEGAEGAEDVGDAEVSSDGR